MASIEQLERAWNSILDKFEAVLRKRLNGHFMRMSTALKKQMDENGELGGTMLLVNADKELEQIFNEALPKVAKEGAKFTLNDLQPKDKENDNIAEAVLASLALWILANSKSRAQLINRTTINIFISITETVTSLGTLQGEDLTREIARRVRARNLARSGVISATETHGVASRGQLQAGVIVNQRVDKSWISQRDRRVRSSHISADGQRVPIDQPFRIGGSMMMYPSDPAGGANETIGCRCFLRLQRIN